MTPSDLTRLEALREACAQVADSFKVTGPLDVRDHLDEANNAACDAIAAAIRALDLARLAPATPSDAATAGDAAAEQTEREEPQS